MSCVGGMPCGDHGYECTCPIDFRGSNCERMYPALCSLKFSIGSISNSYLIFSDPSFCHPNPCENGGACVSEATTYICECPIRYSGKKCQGKINNMVNVRGGIL